MDLRTLRPSAHDCSIPLLACLLATPPAPFEPQELARELPLEAKLPHPPLESVTPCFGPTQDAAGLIAACKEALFWEQGLELRSHMPAALELMPSSIVSGASGQAEALQAFLRQATGEAPLSPSSSNPYVHLYPQQKEVHPSLPRDLLRIASDTAMDAANLGSCSHSDLDQVALAHLLQRGVEGQAEQRGQEEEDAQVLQGIVQLLQRTSSEGAGQLSHRPLAGPCDEQGAAAVLLQAALAGATPRLSSLLSDLLPCVPLEPTSPLLAGDDELLQQNLRQIQNFFWDVDCAEENLALGEAPGFHAEEHNAESECSGTGATRTGKRKRVDVPNDEVQRLNKWNSHH